MPTYVLTGSRDTHWGEIAAKSQQTFTILYNLRVYCSYSVTHLNGCANATVNDINMSLDIVIARIFFFHFSKIVGMLSYFAGCGTSSQTAGFSRWMRDGWQLTRERVCRQEDAVQQTLCWRAHLTKVVQLAYIDSVHAIVSASTDCSVRYDGRQGTPLVHSAKRRRR